MFFIVLAIIAPCIAPYSVTQQTAPVYAPPSAAALAGLRRRRHRHAQLMISGGRISLIVGFAATLVSMVIGGGIGILAGYFGRWIDVALMRVTDYLLVIPDLAFMIVIAGVWGPSLAT